MKILSNQYEYKKIQKIANKIEIIKLASNSKTKIELLMKEHNNQSTLYMKFCF